MAVPLRHKHSVARYVCAIFVVGSCFYQPTIVLIRFHKLLEFGWREFVKSKFRLQRAGGKIFTQCSVVGETVPVKIALVDGKQCIQSNAFEAHSATVTVVL